MWYLQAPQTSTDSGSSHAAEHARGTARPGHCLPHLLHLHHLLPLAAFAGGALSESHLESQSAVISQQRPGNNTSRGELMDKPLVIAQTLCLNHSQRTTQHHAARSRALALPRSRAKALPCSRAHALPCSGPSG
jgi:hypothetical protein